MNLIDKIPDDFIKFLLVTLFSLLIGLEQRRHHFNERSETVFGMDRTYTFIGIFGFILYVIAPARIWLFGLGAILITFFWQYFILKRLKHKRCTV